MHGTRFRTKNIHNIIHFDSNNIRRNIPSRPESHLLPPATMAVTTQTIYPPPTLLPCKCLNAIFMHPSWLDPPGLPEARVRRGPIQQRNRHAYDPMEGVIPLHYSVCGVRIEFDVHEYPETVKFRDESR